MGGEAERRLHFRHGPPPPLRRGTQPHGCWPLAHQVLPIGRRLAGGSLGLGPWPGPPPSPGARHFCRRRSCAGPSTKLSTAGPCPPRSHPWNTPRSRRSEGITGAAAKPTPAAGKISWAGNRPCVRWPSAYRAAGALDAGHATPSSRTNPCSGRAARTKGARPTAAAAGHLARR